MRAILIAWLTLAASVASLPAAEVFPGVIRRVVLPPSPSPGPLVGDLFFAVPPGARWVVVEATTGDPERDFDLFLSLGRTPFENASGVVADFRSESPGPDEHILLSLNSAPPLQTGLYRLVLRSQTPDREMRVSVKVTIDVGGPTTGFVASTFDAGNNEGWRHNFPETDLAGASTGDSSAALAVPPEEVLRLLEPGGENQDFFVAPPKFLGDLSGFIDASFRFDFVRFDGPLSLFPIEMRLIGENAAFAWRGPVPDLGETTAVEVPLLAEEWSRIVGAASFEDSLLNVVRLEVSADQAPGPETNDLDNFIFEGTPAPPPPGGAQPGVSDFESGIEGWRRNHPPVVLPGAINGTENAAVAQGLGGRNSERFLLLVDGDGFNRDFAVAPPKFLGDLARLDRPWFEFYFRQISGDNPRFPVKLRLIGAGSAWEWSGARPRQSWERFFVALQPEFWVHFSGPTDFDATLRNVARLEIAMDVVSGEEAHGLDDFALHTGFVAPGGRALVVTPPSFELSFAPDDGPRVESLRIDVSGGGGLDWAARIEPSQATWLTLHAQAGRAPSDVELRVDPSGLAPGLYRASVLVRSSEPGVEARRIEVTMILGEDPRVPVVNAGGIVHAAHPLAALSPGALASLFGRNLAEAPLALDFDSGRLPTLADGVEVWLIENDDSLLAVAPLLYLGPEQINFQIPYEPSGRSGARLIVVRDGRRSQPVSLALAPTGPGIFSLGGEIASVTRLDGSIHGPAGPAAAGETLTVYFSGAGVARPPLASGEPAPSSPLSAPEASFSVRVGGIEATALSMAMSPGFVGLTQISFEVPAGLPAGRVILEINVGGRRSNGVFLWVR